MHKLWLEEAGWISLLTNVPRAGKMRLLTWTRSSETDRPVAADL
jgi:hypothetical protein